MRLSQLNIADALYDTDDPRMEGFTGRIERINILAERAPGFIWRLTDDGESDGALSLRLEGQGGYTLVNMSVWANINSLYNFVYKTAHAKVMQGKDDWFRPISMAHMVMWYVSDRHRPDLDEAKHKLDLIRDQGATFDAFDFQNPYSRTGTRLTPESAVRRKMEAYHD